MLNPRRARRLTRAGPLHLPDGFDGELAGEYDTDQPAEDLVDELDKLSWEDEEYGLLDEEDTEHLRHITPITPEK